MSINRNVRVLFWLVAALLSTVLSPSAASADPLPAGQPAGLYDGDACLRPLRVGYLPGRAPYQSVSADGVVSGFDIETARDVVQAAGCQPEFVAVGWPRALLLLERGVIDALPGASFSAERATYALFSAPYRREEFALYVRAGGVEAFPLTSLRDVGPMRFRLALNSDALYGPEVADLLTLPDFRRQVVQVRGVEQPALVSIGRVDGYLLDTGTASAYNASVSRSMRLVRHPAATIDNGPVLFMFSRLTVPQGLIDRVNQRISARSVTSEAVQ